MLPTVFLITTALLASGTPVEASGSLRRDRARQGMDCVVAKTPAKLTVHFGKRGCFAHSEDQVVFDMSENSATVTRGGKAVAMSRADAETAVHKLMVASVLPDQPSSCMSTTETYVKMSWTCGSDVADRGELRLSSYRCESATPDRAVAVALEAQRLAHQVQGVTPPPRTQLTER